MAPYSKRIFTTQQAVAAQLQALSSVQPQSGREAAAVRAQRQALRVYASVASRQTAAEARFQTISTRPVYSPQVGSSSAQVGAAAQIRALATADTQSRLLAAVRHGVDMWRLQAHFQNITIVGMTAIGSPGCLAGPELGPWILQAPGVINVTGYLEVLVTAVANAVSANFSQWKSGVAVPGLPWYPRFMAVAAPFAPPTPNIPTPLIACPSTGQAKLMSASQIESGIRAGLGNEFGLPEMDAFLHNLCVRLANYFTTWICSQQVMMVMGMGPVPTYNPPYVPIGEVVNGYVIPSPGHLAV